MKIHTDVLNAGHLATAGTESTTVADLRVCGSRSRAKGFEVFLTGSSPRRGAHYCEAWGDYPPAATYDEWGWFLADLFALDPAMIAGPYKGADDFGVKTRGAYSV